MSEERAKRDADTPDSETSTSADSFGVDDTAADANSRSDLSLDKNEDGVAKAPSGKPSGKRVARGAAVSASAVKTPARAASRPSAQSSGKKPAVKKGNIFKRLRRFFREVVAELRKVIWPNRKQMITYTGVVLAFVVFMVAFIGGVDVAVIKGVTWLFG